MTIKPCPKSHEGCPLYGLEPPEKLSRTQEHGCYSDLDHIVPRRLAKTAIAAVYINRPDNKQQLCRNEHNDKSAKGDEPLPEREFMVETIIADYMTRRIHLSRRMLGYLNIEGINL